MTERKASMGDKVYRGDVVKFIRNNISLDTFMKRTVKTADEACWDLCDKLNYVPAIEECNEPHWIPATERLPEKGIDVLVTRKYDGREDGNKSCCYVEVASCFGQDDGVTWNSYSDEYKMHPRNHSVIAWMPLPEPYKGGEQDG